MRKIKTEIVEGDRGASRTHALQFRMSVSVLADPLMGPLEATDQCVLDVSRRVAVVDVADGIDREATGFLPAFVAAHAIGDQRQSAFLQKLIFALRLPVGEGVFVIFTLAAYVAKTGHLDSGANLHQTSQERKYNWRHTKSFQTADRLSPRSPRTPRLSRTPSRTGGWARRLYSLSREKMEVRRRSKGYEGTPPSGILWERIWFRYSDLTPFVIGEMSSGVVLHLMFVDFVDMRRATRLAVNRFRGRLPAHRTDQSFFEVLLRRFCHTLDQFFPSLHNSLIGGKRASCRSRFFYALDQAMRMRVARRTCLSRLQSQFGSYDLLESHFAPVIDRYSTKGCDQRHRNLRGGRSSNVGDHELGVQSLIPGLENR